MPTTVIADLGAGAGQPRHAQCVLALLNPPH